MHFEDILPGSYIQLEISGADNTDIVDAQVKAAKKNVVDDMTKNVKKVMKMRK